MNDTDRHPREFLRIKNSPAFAIVVDERDHAVLATVRYETAQRADFHHHFYVPQQFIERVDDGEARVVWGDDRGIHSLEPMPAAMRAALQQYHAASATNADSNSTDLKETDFFNGFFEKHDPTMLCYPYGYGVMTATIREALEKAKRASCARGSHKKEMLNKLLDYLARANELIREVDAERDRRNMVEHADAA